jgi:hypothetical protein
MQEIVASSNFNFLKVHDIQLVRIGTLADATSATTRTPAF